MLANVKKANVSKDTNYILDNQIYNQIYSNSAANKKYNL